jgi:hypothetical protein
MIGYEDACERNMLSSAHKPKEVKRWSIEEF